MGHHPQNATLSVRHGGGSVTAWGCVAARGRGQLTFTDDVTADRSTKMDLELYRAVVCSDSAKCSKIDWTEIPMEWKMEKDPKQTTKPTQMFL